MEFRRKPIEVEAFRLGYDEIPRWFQEQVRANNIANIDAFLENVNEIVKIKTLEGVMSAKQGDFIIKGVKGEVYPCKAEIFKEIYDYIPLKHIEEGDELSNITIFLDEAHYLGEDAGDIIVIDENHKIMSEAQEDGLITKIYIYDNNDGTVNTIPLYENGKRLMDKVVVPETFTSAVASIDKTKMAYEYLKIEIIAKDEETNETTETVVTEEETTEDPE